MADLIGRVARAMFEADVRRWKKLSQSWDDLGPGSHTQDEWMRHARAAIGAMRVPDDGWADLPHGSQDQEAINAYIDKALKTPATSR